MPNKTELESCTIDAMIRDVHQIAVEHGWWEDKRNDAECIALMHSELSEALEAMRNNRPNDEKLPEYDKVTVELADCIIRIFDFAGARDLNLVGALNAKIEFNRNRPYKHGGKKF